MNKLILLSFKFLQPGFLKSEINRLLVMSVAFSIAMVGARVLYTGQPHFIFLVWNLFLAFVPYFISSQLSVRAKMNPWLLGASLVVWLLFIPNSFYIITDLFHLYDSHLVPRWFDLALIISFAWNALIMGILSVRQVEKLVKPKLRYSNDLVFIFPLMCLNALGVYVGRYMRFNSWDVISNPFSLMGDIADLALHPVRSLNAWAMIICYSVLLSILYVSLRKTSRMLSR